MSSLVELQRKMLMYIKLREESEATSKNTPVALLVTLPIRIWHEETGWAAVYSKPCRNTADYVNSSEESVMGM